MRDALIVLFLMIIIISVLAFITNLSEFGWRIGIGEKPLWVQCEETFKKVKDFDAQYVIKEFKAGRLNHLFEKGWTDFGLGSSIDRMEYFVLYYPLDEYTRLEVRYEGKMFLDNCKNYQWPPEIIESQRSIWFMGGTYIGNARGKSYKWLKKHKEYWKLKRV